MGVVAQWFRQHALASKQRRLVRNKRFHSFDTAKTVGLVFKMEKNVVPPEVLSTVKFLKEKGITCFSIGYYDEKELPEGFLGTASVSVFCKKDLSWYGRPASDDVNRFLQQDYDIVIDLCREADVFPVQYVVSATHASMTIGGVQYARCPYDLIIDAQKSCSLDGYVEQIKHYLSIINNPQNVEQQKEN
ncbi:MAG: hypothetical protein LBU92_01755 [Prevotellaceae bacterium]|jgi:hypothetical protein|nr:hypothetical protein [Prevotellaceae bacterium]